MLLKTIYAAICGSDLEYLDGSFQLMSHGTTYVPPALAPRVTQQGASPFGIRPGSIPGHEFVAEVMEVGEGIEGWSAGDRAIPVGHPNPRGAQPGEGYETYRCMAEYFLSTPFGVIKVPDHVPNEEAIFIEPLTTGNGAAAKADVQKGQSTVVIGSGKIGILAALSAKAKGSSPVIIIDLVQSRLDKALSMGVDVALNSGEVDVIPEVIERTGMGVDNVLICVRDGQVLNQAVEMVKRGGAQIVLAGFVTPMEVNPMLWSVKQLSVHGILGGSMLEAFKMITERQIDPKPLISEVIPFDDCQRAIDSVYSGENIACLLSP